MFKKISRRDFTFPRDFNKNEQHLIGGLLMVDLTRRLGNMHQGVEDIKNEPYFASVDFDALRAEMVPSPYARHVAVSGPGDTSQFDKYPEEPVSWHPGKDKHAEIFANF
jgi:hypothetical protein